MVTTTPPIARPLYLLSSNTKSTISSNIDIIRHCDDFEQRINQHS